MAPRVFPIDDWAPAQSQAFTSDFSTLYGTMDSEEIIQPRATTSSGFRKRLASLPFGRDSDISTVTEKLALEDNLNVPDTGKREGRFRGFMRRASVSMKRMQRRHSNTEHSGAAHVTIERPQTPSAWHKLRQAASFSRNSRCFPQQCFEGESSTDSAEYLWPRPGYGNAPPIIPRGSGGEAARATAAAQNEILFSRNRILLSPDHQLEDRESGIGIAVTEYQDASIDRVDFIAKLPNELAIQILEKLDHHSLVRTSLVSKGWYQVSCDNQIWRQAFMREKSKTYAMSGPIKMGSGLGIPSPDANHNFKDLYRIKQQLERNWLEGKAEAIYLNGHEDSIYCVQFDE